MRTLAPFLAVVLAGAVPAVTLVDRQATYAHNDPNSAAPGKNVFLKGLVRFLRRISTG